VGGVNWTAQSQGPEVGFCENDYERTGFLTNSGVIEYRLCAPLRIFSCTV